MSCIFCKIIAGDSPAEIVEEWDDAIAFVPINPCTPGHILVVPRVHVKDALEDPTVTAATFKRAAELVAEDKALVPDDSPDANLITNAGPLAGQTVFHLHVHIVPRRVGDGLRLPWTL